MVFASGFAGLVYQILWMRQLGVLFGNTSHAAAVTLAAFFAGLAHGSWYWGRRVASTARPLRVYAGLELGILITTLFYFVVFAVFSWIYPMAYRSLGSGPLLLSIKFALALLLIFPPAFCMGGTIPVIAQFLIRRSDELGVRGAMLYGVNTLGAALGALVAGFYLVGRLGQRATCVSAMTVTGLVAVAAWWLSRGTSPARDDRSDAGRDTARALEPHGRGVGRRLSYAICFLSGFGVLALEVLWTRMGAQIHENSIYSFSSVLVVVLACLALGALLASRLAKTALPPHGVLAGLLMVSGVALMASPFVFMDQTNDLQMLDVTGSFAGYVGTLFLKGFIFIGLPALPLATIFPYLMKVEERSGAEPGLTLGRLSAVNTVGAVLGALLCGFVLLGWLGMWGTTQGVAALYLVAGLLLPLGWGVPGILVRASAFSALLLLFTAASPTSLPVTGSNPARPPEEVLEVWETSDCTVSVVRHAYGLAIKVNSNYYLGATSAMRQQVRQGFMPMLIQPGTKSVCFLGLGTGITAGAALSPYFASVERVVACELVPEIVTAARIYMAGERPPAETRSRRTRRIAPGPDLTGGLFTDSRVEILIEDGRHYLMATDERFDMINADLFLPYRRGAGSLYSREHFEQARARLNAAGIFVQWLPAFQMTETEFGTVAKTMLSVFDQVTLWRHDFEPGKEIVALMGHRDAGPFLAEHQLPRASRRALVEGVSHRELQSFAVPLNEATMPLFYCGNVTAARELFEQYPLNTDDRPVVEYSAPRSIRQSTDGFPPTLVGPRLAALVSEIFVRCPPERDPMLAEFRADTRRLPVAGAALHEAWIGLALNDLPASREGWARFVHAFADEGGGAQLATPSAE